MLLNTSEAWIFRYQMTIITSFYNEKKCRHFDINISPLISLFQKGRFSFFFTLKICLWILRELQACIQYTLIILILSPLSKSSRIHLLSPTHPNFMFSFVYIFITHRAHIVLPTCIDTKAFNRVWSIYQDHILKGNWLFFPKRPSTVQSSPDRSSGLMNILPMFRWWLTCSCAYFVQAAAVAVRLWVVRSPVRSKRCCFTEVLCLLQCFLPLSVMLSEPWGKGMCHRRVCDIDVPFVAEWSAASHVTYCSTYHSSAMVGLQLVTMVDCKPLLENVQQMVSSQLSALDLSTSLRHSAAHCRHLL